MNSVSGGDNFDAEDCNHVHVLGRIPISRKRERTVRIDSGQLREGLTRGKLINFRANHIPAKPLKLGKIRDGWRYQIGRILGKVPRGAGEGEVIFTPKIYVADFGNFKQGFLSMKLIQKSNFRVQKNQNKTRL